MKFAFPLAFSLALGVFVVPAYAQLSGGPMGGGMSMGGVGGAPMPKLKTPAPDIAPAGLPGIGAVAPPVAEPQTQLPARGDPTKELFTAINKNDYNSAMDAISRGANLSARDQFGETPLDLSIALNRNNITFLLLGTRNELASQDGSNTMMGARWTLPSQTGSARPSSHDAAPLETPTSAKANATPVLRTAIPASDTGTPDPQAGFLGFSPKN